MRAFEAWGPDDTAYVTEGTQGGHMIVYSLRLGAGAPACIAQKTTIKQNGQVIASQNSALNTYDNGDGTRSTKDNYLVFGDEGPPLGSQVVVTTTAGGKTVSSTLTIVADRNKLESLTVVTASPHVGYSIDFQLKSRHAPPYSGFTVTAQTSNVSVASASPPQYIYDDTTTFQGSAYSAGSATITVQMAGSDQMVTAPVTVIP
jgi:hypothetical protein